MAVTLILAGIAYFVSGATLALSCIFFGVVIVIVLHSTRQRPETTLTEVEVAYRHAKNDEQVRANKEKIAALEELGPDVLLDLEATTFVPQEWEVSVQNVSDFAALKVDLRTDEGEWKVLFDIIPLLIGRSQCRASQSAITYNGNSTEPLIRATIRAFLKCSQIDKSARIARIITVSFESQSGVRYERDFELSCTHSLTNGMILAHGNRRITQRA